MSITRVLLIGNGPAALSKKVGSLIDDFDGWVVRFNNYKTEGFEEYVGSRTDVWATCERNAAQMGHNHKKRLLVAWNKSPQNIEKANDLKADFVPIPLVSEVVRQFQGTAPSSGVIVTEYFSSLGIDVWIWGFDFLSRQRTHHYNRDRQVRGENHDEWKEWYYFHEKEQKGKVSFFGLGKYESIPIYKQPAPCGTDENLGWYREAAHNAWYDWFGSMATGDAVLDVGAGLCEGMKVLESHKCRVTCQDVDERLKKINPNLVVGGLHQFGDNSFDYVTCVDVIEHVVEDIKLMDDMKRIARKGIFLTTPCYTRSRCGNIAHCREYSIPQFANIFKPNDVWSASPDGKVHRTHILTRDGYKGWYDYSPQWVENSKKNEKPRYIEGDIPVTHRFNSTIDGEEWAHICAIWGF